MSVAAEEDIEDEEIVEGADEGEDGDDTFVDDGDDDDPGEGDEPTEIERIAMEGGWKPKDQWKGPGWKPAEEFLRHTAKAAKDSRREARDLTERLGALEATSRVTLDRQADAIRAEAKRLKDAAIAKGGKDAIAEVEEIEKIAADELAKLETDAKPQKLTALDRRAFADHAWMYDDESFSDPDLKADADDAIETYTDTFNRVLKTTGDPAEAHERAGKAVRKAHPDRYEADEEKPEKKPGRRAPDLARGNTSSREGGRNLTAKLGAPEMAAARDAVKRGIYGSVEEWAEVWDEERKKGRRA